MPVWPTMRRSENPESGIWTGFARSSCRRSSTPNRPWRGSTSTCRAVTAANRRTSTRWTIGATATAASSATAASFPPGTGPHPPGGAALAGVQHAASRRGTPVTLHICQYKFHTHLCSQGRLEYEFAKRKFVLQRCRRICHEVSHIFGPMR